MRLMRDVARAVVPGDREGVRPEGRGVELRAARDVTLAAVQSGSRPVVAGEGRPDLLPDRVRRTVPRRREGDRGGRRVDDRVRDGLLRDVELFVDRGDPEGVRAEMTRVDREPDRPLPDTTVVEDAEAAGIVRTRVVGRDEGALLEAGSVARGTKV